MLLSAVTSQTASLQWSTSGYERQKPLVDHQRHAGRNREVAFATDGPPQLVSHLLLAGHPCGGGHILRPLLSGLLTLYRPTGMLDSCWATVCDVVTTLNQH